MTLSPAVITLLGRSFDVLEFSGTEKLNSSFNFEVVFISDQSLKLNKALNSGVVLSARGVDNLERSWIGVINNISSLKCQNTQKVTLKFIHPLNNLKFHTSEQHFYFKNELDVAISYLHKHQINFKLNGLNSCNFQEQEFIHQVDGQSDIDFLHQLLACIGVIYYINDASQMVLFRNVSFLKNSFYDTLSYLPDQHRFVKGVPHFYNLTYTFAPKKNQSHIYSHDLLEPQTIIENETLSDEPQNQAYDISGSHQNLDLFSDNYQQQFISKPLEIQSSLALLKVGEHIKISIAAFDMGSGWYVIDDIQHSFNIESDSGYQNQVGLIRTNAVQPNVINKYSANNIAMAKVVATDEHSNLDSDGNYKYQLSNYQETNGELELQQSLPRLTSFGGAGIKGMHFPLQNNDEIMLGYVNGSAEKPIILSNFFNAHQNCKKQTDLNYQNVFATSGNLTWRLNDKLDNECIELEANLTTLKLDATKDKHQIKLHSTGSIEFNAEKNIDYQVDSLKINVVNNSLYKIKQLIHYHIGGDYHEKINQSTSIKSDVYHAKTQKALSS